MKDDEAEKAAQLRDAENQKSRLMQTANDNIAPLQDAAELNMATDDEKNQLAAWKKYRVLLSRVNPAEAEKIRWPDKPA